MDLDFTRSTNVIGREPGHKVICLPELQTLRNLIAREREAEITCLAELPAPKNLLGLEW